MTRRKQPSRAVWVGAPIGAALSIVAVEVAKQCGLEVSTELATAVTTLCTFGASYLIPGGRHGEGA